MRRTINQRTCASAGTGVRPRSPASATTATPISRQLLSGSHFSPACAHDETAYCFSRKMHVWRPQQPHLQLQRVLASPTVAFPKVFLVERHLQGTTRTPFAAQEDHSRSSHRRTLLSSACVAVTWCLPHTWILCDATHPVNGLLWAGLRGRPRVRVRILYVAQCRARDLADDTKDIPCRVQSEQSFQRFCRSM